MEDEFEGDAEYPAPLLEPVEDDDGDVTELFAASTSIGAAATPASQMSKSTGATRPQVQRRLFSQADQVTSAAPNNRRGDEVPTDASDEGEVAPTPPSRKRAVDEAEDTDAEDTGAGVAPPARRQKP